MNLQERNNYIRKFFNEKCVKLLEQKGADYGKGDQGPQSDPNHIFATIASLIGIEKVDKYFTWAVLFFKHIEAICTWIRSRDLKSEKIDSRITDAVNYLLIMMSMIEEDRRQQEMALQEVDEIRGDKKDE